MHTIVLQSNQKSIQSCEPAKVRRACAALGDEPAAPQAALRNGLAHDGQRHAVFDAAAWVQELRLAQDLRAHGAVRHPGIRANQIGTMFWAPQGGIT